MSAPPGLVLFLREVARGEAELEQELHRVAERHRTEHEVHHVAIDLARWSRENREALATLSDRYGEDLADVDAKVSPGPLTLLREKTAELLGRRPEPGLLLLHDLRHLELMATGNAAQWIAIGQAAQALRDAHLHEIVKTCQGRTTRQATWCKATLKELSAQALTAR